MVHQVPPCRMPPYSGAELRVVRMVGLCASVVLAAACAPSGQPATPEAAAQVVADTVALQWRPSWPGTEMALVRGDPYKGGEWAFRFRMPAGYWIYPHRHPVDAHIRVVSGTFLVGDGEQLDTSRVRVLGPGRTIELQLGMPHFEGTREATDIEVHGAGTWGITFVDPAKDPARAAAPAGNP